MLAAGERSHWHRVDAAEICHFHAGAPLALEIEGQGVVTLGVDQAAGQRPQTVAPRGAWQAARRLRDWTLCGCTVAPGFEFAGFQLAPDETPISQG